MNWTVFWNFLLWGGLAITWAGVAAWLMLQATTHRHHWYELAAVVVSLLGTATLMGMLS